MSLRATLCTLSATILLCACATQEVKPAPKPAPPPVVEKQPSPPQPKKVAKPLQPAPPPPVVVLVSEAIPAYQEVADELHMLLEKRASVVVLSGKRSARRQQLEQLKKPEYQQFVAIGLAAAKQARAIVGDEDEVVFCQVFNYQDFDLVGPRSKGVGALPGSLAMFATWRKMSPSLQHVAVLTGAGLEEEIQRARREAKRVGIELHHIVVASDKEVLFAYKSLAPTIQGLWLLPDNRVLSGRVIREMMSFSVRHGKQVVVFNDSLLRLGGVLSLSARKSEIAKKVVQRLDDAYQGRGVPGPELMPLEDGDLSINTVAAKRYRLNLPQ